MDSISGNVSGRVDCSFAGDADRIGNAHRIAGVNVPPDLARRPAGNQRARRSSGRQGRMAKRPFLRLNRAGRALRLAQAPRRGAQPIA